jgi:2-polyprenyl-3-methyl-5-hydroxy-6-metoxy-1,4-benzoquinol methylase
MMARGVLEARTVSPELVDRQFEECLTWLVREHGEEVLAKLADGYAFFTMEVNLAQLAYERRGSYEFSTFAEADARIYQQSAYMRDYYGGVFAILFCWSHYVELMDFYLGRFVSRLSAGRLVEIAPGHGAWGVLAVTNCDGLTLDGWDISPTSLELAPKMAAGAGVGDRCTYHLGDATKIEHIEGRYDAAICSFMLEHLEEPGQFLVDFAPSLRSGALVFLTLALTAAQTDHIYEFKRESEGILLAETAGFELLECRIARPQRLLPGARFVPRVQAMILRKI